MSKTMNSIALKGNKVDTGNGTAEIIGGDYKLKVNGIPVALVGDKISSHYHSRIDSDGDTVIETHSNAVITSGSSKLFVNKIPVALTGSKTSCGIIIEGNNKILLTNWTKE